VYHSHVLEHLDRRDAPGFLGECRRVLKPGGFLRVVVPDLEALVCSYVTSLPAAEEDGGDRLTAHERAVERLLEQLVREEPYGAAQQRPLVRTLERLVRGSARQAGEVHRWMYDRHTLRAALRQAGFARITPCSVATSHVEDWSRYGLDVNEDGSAYIADSLYMEAMG
jgi:ubiquinone/menaquinone biosynthesis C-methylase UbiE